MAEMTEVAARKYGRLIEAMDTLYANSTGAQKEWIDNNWKSILDGMVERGEEMIQGWKAQLELFKVAKDTYGDVHYFKTLQEAKDLVDEMRESHDFDYGFIMRVEAIYVDEHTVEDETEIGDWGEFEEEWETAAAQIANDGTARVRTEPEPDHIQNFRVCLFKFSFDIFIRLFGFIARFIRFWFNLFLLLFLL